MGPAISTECTSVVLVNVVDLNQAITATASTGMAVPVTSTKRMLEFQARVLMALNQMAIVILLFVLILHTLVLATSTENTLIVMEHVLELDQAVTATSLAQLTCTTGPATSTKRTLVVQARVLME